MRTFPKSLATFQKIVDERGRQLRTLDFDELKQRTPPQPIEELTVDSRRASIATIVQNMAAGNLRVVVQGFMQGSFLGGKHVALNGFYKQPDNVVVPMPAEEFDEFD